MRCMLHKKNTMMKTVAIGKKECDNRLTMTMGVMAEWMSMIRSMVATYGNGKGTCEILSALWVLSDALVQFLKDSRKYRWRHREGSLRNGFDDVGLKPLHHHLRLVCLLREVPHAYHVQRTQVQDLKVSLREGVDTLELRKQHGAQETYQTNHRLLEAFHVLLRVRAVV